MGMLDGNSMLILFFQIVSCMSLACQCLLRGHRLYGNPLSRVIQRRKISLSRHLLQIDYYNVLGVNRSSSEKDIKKEGDLFKYSTLFQKGAFHSRYQIRIC